MPHRYIDKEILDLPEWLDDIDDECLSKMLVEALYARAQAVKEGALDHREARGEIRSADDTVDQIAYRRYRGAAACRKAADALRKYTHALDHVSTISSRARGAVRVFARTRGFGLARIPRHAEIDITSRKMIDDRPTRRDRSPF